MNNRVFWWRRHVGVVIAKARLALPPVVLPVAGHWRIIVKNIVVAFIEAARQFALNAENPKAFTDWLAEEFYRAVMYKGGWLGEEFYRAVLHRESGIVPDSHGRVRYVSWQSYDPGVALFVDGVQVFRAIEIDEESHLYEGWWISPKDGLRQKAERKERNRLAAKNLASAQEAVAKALAEGHTVLFYPGPKGGTISLLTLGDEVRIPAIPALRRAGIHIPEIVEGRAEESLIGRGMNGWYIEPRYDDDAFDY